MSDDEQELQERLERAPEAGDIRDYACVLCGDPAEHWVPEDDIDIILPEEWEGRLVPLCDDCKEIAVDDPCDQCDLGLFCIDHDDLDWLADYLNNTRDNALEDLEEE